MHSSGWLGRAAAAATVGIATVGIATVTIPVAAHAAPSGPVDPTPRTAVQHVASPQRHGDIDGDGRDDLVVAGRHAVRVYYSSAGATGHRVQVIAVPSGVDSVATGDFNGDGFGDVAAGSSDALGTFPSSDGEVFVWYGSTHGLNPAKRVDFPGPKGQGTGFGSRVVALDLNADGRSDLLIEPSSLPEFIHLTVLFGTRGGLSTRNRTHLRTTDAYGVAMGDLNGDGHPDLVVGRADTGAQLTDGGEVLETEGTIIVYYGTGHGLGKSGHVIHGRAAGAGFGAFGTAIAIANVNGDKYADAIVGAPTATVGGRSEAGAVVVLYGGKSGLSPARRTRLTVASKGVPGTPHGSDELGSAIAAGDVNGDGYDDVIAGAPQPFGGHGEAFVLRGSSRGATGRHAQRLTAGALGGTGFGGPGFGTALVAFYPRANRHASVAVGAPDYEPSATATAHGYVDIYAGAWAGLTRRGAHHIVCTTNREAFGESLAA